MGRYLHYSPISRRHLDYLAKYPDVLESWRNGENPDEIKVGRSLLDCLLRRPKPEADPLPEDWPSQEPLQALATPELSWGNVEIYTYTLNRGEKFVSDAGRFFEPYRDLRKRSPYFVRIDDETTGIDSSLIPQIIDMMRTVDAEAVHQGYPIWFRDNMVLAKAFGRVNKDTDVDADCQPGSREVSEILDSFRELERSLNEFQKTGKCLLQITC